MENFEIAVKFHFQSFRMRVSEKSVFKVKTVVCHFRYLWYFQYR